MKSSWVGVLAACVLVGCAGTTSRKPPVEIFRDMDRQPKYTAQTESPLFADGRAERQPVPGTLARENYSPDPAFTTGIVNNQYVGLNPLPYTREVLLRGQQRFNIYCAPCHDRAGTGRGTVAVRSGWPAGNLHEERIKQMRDGELFSVITNGRRTMPGYQIQIPVADRWAIVAYLRALQRASSGTIEDVPRELREALQ